MTVKWTFKTFDQLTALELYKILQLREEVFMIEQNCIYKDCDNIDLESNHLWAVIDNEIIAYARIIPPSVEYMEASIGRVISKKTKRGLGLGKQLFKYSVEIIENTYPSSPIRINAQVYLKNFYSCFGFIPDSEEYLYDGLPHIEMLKGYSNK